MSEAAFSPVLSFRLRLLLVAFCEETFTVVYPVYTLSDTTSYTLRVPASILLFFFSLGRNLSIAAKQQWVQTLENMQRASHLNGPYGYDTS